jgi:hypothetical protein
MGVPIPTAMDGRVVLTALTDEMRENLQISFADPEHPTGGEQGGSILGEEDEKVIRERLEALGYFG